jgi:hypothetical protein
MVFKLTAVLDAKTSVQLENFAITLTKYYKSKKPVPTDWFTAFEQLRILVASSKRKRKVIFIDEMPWLDTKGSDFIAALEHFWNDWASTQNNIMLIICGSSASWIVKKLFRNRGGLHNRVTGRILLKPFTLSECRMYCAATGLPNDEISLLETYMTFGGIPYYLDLLKPGLSLTQNVGKLCFGPGGELREEFDNLYASLFANAQRHMLVVRALAKRKTGLSRDEIRKTTNIAEGGTLTDTLNELELSGFIRRYEPFGKKKRGSLYQLVDHFTLFHLAFIENSPDDDSSYWAKIRETQAFRTWRGYAFEQVCLAHVDQIRKSIGVAGVITHTGSWRSTSTDPMVQVDLLLDRNDRVVSLCEMKFTDLPYAINKKTAGELRQKRSSFIEETGTRKATHLVLVTPIGLKRNTYYDLVQNVVTTADLLTD